MRTVHTAKHRLRAAETELHGGSLRPPFECPERVDLILARIVEVGLGPVVEPRSFPRTAIARVHDDRYLDFLEHCWRDWRAAGYSGEAIPACWPARRMAGGAPRAINGRIGYHALAADTSITAGTWDAAQAAAEVALTGAEAVRRGARGVFALCRPPGHHATADQFGGYCFLNNAAIAAQSWLDEGAARVAILDVDFHHGNGAQDLFWHRSDVLVISIHGEPERAFPYFVGHAHETGAGEGEGFTVNYPLPPGTGFERWSECLGDACRRIADFAPDGLVVSLGVDTFVGDPLSFFELESDDFSTYGERLGKLARPTLFCLEGGYAVERIGINTVNVLQGFEAA